PAARSRSGWRKRYLREHLVITQHVFPRSVDGRQREELRRRNRALPRGTADPKRRIERDQCRRGVRRVNDVTRTTAEDRVELVLAGRRKTGIATVFQAWEAIAKVPAPGPLTDVPGKRGHISDLRRGE